jgi:hypothetical protein
MTIDDRSCLERGHLNRVVPMHPLLSQGAAPQQKEHLRSDGASHPLGLVNNHYDGFMISVDALASI